MKINIRNKKKLKTVGKLFFLAVFLVILFITFCNIIIPISSDKYIYDRVEDIPYNKVGLVLGTSRFLGNGTPNLYFNYRIDAAAALFKAGKINYIVVSGDNSRKTYNEPEDMKNELIKKGIPENVIYLDYAGFRTLDSVIRVEEIFGQQQFTIISQQFHNERAVFIARYYNLDPYAYNAKDVDIKVGLKTRIREIFARVKVFIDIFTGKEPRFLGESIEIK